MKSVRKYFILLLRKNLFVLCSLMGFALVNNVVGRGLSEGLLTESEFGNCTPVFQSSFDFSSSGFIQWSSPNNFDIGSSPQFIKTKSSHPLSLLNFNKTRPRGIPPQEPVQKNLILSNVIHIYPPYLSSFIDLTQFFYYSLMWANSLTIRPPPTH